MLMMTTVNGIKRNIGIPSTNTVEDTYLSDLIKQVSALIEKYIGGKIEYSTTTNYKTAGNGFQRLFLPNIPVISLQSVLLDDVEIKDYCEIEGIRTIFYENGFTKKSVSLGLEYSPLNNYEYKNINIDYTYGWVMPTYYTINATTISDSGGKALFTTVGHNLSDNNVVQLAGTLPANFTSGVDYYVVKKTNDTFTLKPTSTGSEIAYLTAGSGVSFTRIDVERTLPYDLEYVCIKVIERLFSLKGRPLNTRILKSGFGSMNFDTQFSELKNIFSVEELAILDNYRLVI